MNGQFGQHARLGIISYLLVGFLIVGCAMTGTRTAGETEGLRWHAKDFRKYTIAPGERETYEYTLVLDETEGRSVTITKFWARFRYNPNSPESEWEKTGNWRLPAHGSLEVPLGTYRYCIASTCHDWGPFAPVWHLVLTGTDDRGEIIRKIIYMRLPYTDETASIHAVRSVALVAFAPYLTVSPLDTTSNAVAA